MFPLRRPFESEKLQLQQLNQRLGQYLSRAKVLEQENARLLTEINATRRTGGGGECERTQMAELREMRRLVERLYLEKSSAEMEREKLRNELEELRTLRCDESAISQSVSGELKGCEKQLHQLHHNNAALEERLHQLENQYAFLEDAHKQEMARLRSQVHTRVVPVGLPASQGLPTVTMEEVQEYAHQLSESWMETFDMYRQRVEEIEESIRADQATLEDLRREKAEYAAELNRLRAEMEKQSQIQLHLENQLMNMQDTFRGDICQYQVMIEELEHEHMLLGNTIAEKLKQHQELLQVKMGLGMEVAAYSIRLSLEMAEQGSQGSKDRALLEGEGKLAQMRSDQHSRERTIDIKLSAQPHTPRISTLTARAPDVRRNFSGFDVRYMEPLSSVRGSSLSGQFDSRRSSRIVPITVSNRAQQSPAERRDMVAFTKAKQAATASTTKSASTTKPEISVSQRTKEVLEKRSVKVKDKGQEPPKTSPERLQAEAAYKPVASVRVVSPTMMKIVETKYDRKDERVEPDHAKETEKPGETQFQFVLKEEFKPEAESDVKESVNVGPRVFAGEEKILDSVSVEEIIEKVMKPAGLDPKLSSSSPEAKITYHVEKTEQEDGSTKTQIVMQTKVEEDLDISDDNVLEELLNKGVKKVSLENIEGTATGSMIQNILSLGLQGESLENKSINVEIIEEPVESQSDEEGEIEIEETVEVKSKPYFKPSSVFFQIEEPENEPPLPQQHESADETVESSEYHRSGSVQVQEVPREENLPYYSQGQESQEYFVSTPEDNLSESEEGGGFMSYGHYGVVDDLSDERYYQDEALPTNRRYSDGDSNRESPEYAPRDSFPQCIIEEEVRVSPLVQESVLEILKEESLDPREQLMGALEHLEGTVSGTLKEEIALLTKAGEIPENVSIDIKKVEQAADNGTMTFVAELNVSQSLEESGLLSDQADDLSQEQLMAALKSSSPGLHQALSSGGYTVKVSKEEVQSEGMPWMSSLEEMENRSSDSEVSRTENVIKLGPNEKSFTFQMDFNSASTSTSGQQGGEVDSQSDGAIVQEFLETQMIDPSLKVCHEKRIATVYLESTKED